jgi:hypothetical protein
MNAISVEKYNTNCSHSPVRIGNNIHISTWNYETSRLELQKYTLEFVISFSKVYLWRLGLMLANSFWDHVIQILIR